MNRENRIKSTSDWDAHGRPGPFVIDLASDADHFRTLSAAHFDVSSRFVLPAVDILHYLKTYFMYLNFKQIDTVFGNAVYPSRLYGGRPYKLEHSITDAHVQQLQQLGIGISLTLTNHFFDKATYEDNQDFLNRFHHTGNTIVCTNDELARRIREDFPNYKLKASLIKHLNTEKKVEAAFKLYEYVVIPMDKNDDERFLRSLPEKHRIYLFGNASCAYNCPSRSCYVGISQTNQHQPQTSTCSIPTKPRPDEGHIFFNVQAFQEMGYNRFKMVPNNVSSAQKALRVLSERRKVTASSILPKVPTATVYSYPKSGRSWLRFILANYLNELMQLGLPINFQSIFTLLPNAGSDPLKGSENYQFSQRAEIPLITFAHLPLPPNSNRALLLLRSIPDTLVSEYFHHTRLLQNSTQDSIAQFVDGESGALLRQLQFLNESLTNLNQNVFITTYERLKDNPLQNLMPIVNFLGITVQSDHLSTAIANSDFERMQNLERTHGIAGHHQQNYHDPEARRVRKGRVGGHVDYLSPELIDYCRKTADEQLTDQAKQYLTDLGLYPF